jgi:hypothetical protein
MGSNVQKRKGHRNVQGRIGCCWEQCSIEERTPKCPVQVITTMTSTLGWLLSCVLNKGHFYCLPSSNGREMTLVSTTSVWETNLVPNQALTQSSLLQSISRKGCCWEQHSIEERTPKCPLADRDVVGSNIQERGGHMSVHGRTKLPLKAPFKLRTWMSIGRSGCLWEQCSKQGKTQECPGNIQRKDMNVHWQKGGVEREKVSKIDQIDQSTVEPT